LFEIQIERAGEKIAKTDQKIYRKQGTQNRSQKMGKKLGLEVRR